MFDNSILLSIYRRVQYLFVIDLETEAKRQTARTNKQTSTICGGLHFRLYLALTTTPLVAIVAPMIIKFLVLFLPIYYYYKDVDI